MVLIRFLVGAPAWVIYSLITLGEWVLYLFVAGIFFIISVPLGIIVALAYIILFILATRFYFILYDRFEEGLPDASEILGTWIWGVTKNDYEYNFLRKVGFNGPTWLVALLICYAFKNQLSKNLLSKLMYSPVYLKFVVSFAASLFLITWFVYLLFSGHF